MISLFTGSQVWLLSVRVCANCPVASVSWTYPRSPCPQKVQFLSLTPFVRVKMLLHDYKSN